MLKNAALCSTILAMACAVSVSAQALADPATKIDVPAGDLTVALRALAKQSGVEFVYSAERLKGVHTVGVKGEYTPEQAVSKLLEGTELKLTVHSTGALLISDARPGASGAVLASEPAARGVEVERESPRKSRLAQAEVAPAAGATEGAAGTSLEEITVTATKRAENIRDVPISITAITAKDIERRGLFNAADYLRGVPGANQVEGGPFTSAIVIRGIETSASSQNFNSGTTTATYFGETPTTSSAGFAGNSNADIKLVDVERVEVLRGPQGTAFGSASLGGAVRVIPVAPKLDRYEFKALAGYSQTSGTGGDNYNFQAVGNFPIVTDRFALRAVGYKYRDSGIYRNRAGSDAAFQANVVIPRGIPAQFAVDQDDVGAYEVWGGRLSALFQATDRLSISATYLKQINETDGIATASSGTYEQTFVQVAPPLVRRGQTGGYFDIDLDLFNTTAEYDLGWGSVLATYSHIDSLGTTATSTQFFGVQDGSSNDGISSHKEHVAEVRVATSFQGPWNFLAGLYYQNTKDGDGDDYFQKAYRLRPPGVELWYRSIERRESDETAAFGEVSWKILPALTLTAGARRYDYDRDRLALVSASETGGVPNINSSGASGTIYRANLSYKPIEAALVYATFSQGFRLGRPQNDPGNCVPTVGLDRNCDGTIDGTPHTIAQTAALEPDSVDNYEIGGKFALMDGRLSIDTALFRMDWTDIPVTLLAPPAPVGAGLTYVLNAGEARVEGIELQSSIQLLDAVRVDVGGSWLDARLLTDVAGVAGSRGNRLAGSPRVNANMGAQYDFRIAGYESSLRVDSIYVGEFFGDILESQIGRAGGYVKWDTSLRVNLDRVNVDLFVKNLTDRHDFSYRRVTADTSGLFGSRLRPRTVGVQLSYSF